MDMKADASYTISISYVTNDKILPRSIPCHKRLRIVQPQPKTQKIDSIKFGTVWKYISGGHKINGPHDSLVDAKLR